MYPRQAGWSAGCATGAEAGCGASGLYSWVHEGVITADSRSCYANPEAGHGTHCASTAGSAL